MWISFFRPLFPRRALVALFTLVLGSGALHGVAQAQNSPEAQRVLDRARVATGGAAAWNSLRGLHEIGRDPGGPFERWLDPLRYGIRIETRTPAGKLVQAYNGAGEWRILPSGVITGSVEKDFVARVRSEAFFGAYAYFYPSRFDLRSTHLGVRDHQGKSYNVLRVQPAGGAPRELWFDRRSGLLGLIVDETGPRRLTTELSDYRRAGPVLVPFKSTTYGGDLLAPLERRIERMDLAPANRDLFSLPPPKH